MTHPRKLIRAAITARLKTAVSEGVFRTAAGPRVYPARIAPIDVEDDDEFPAILVYTRDESRDPHKSYGPDGEDSWLSAELKIVVEGIVRGGTTVDDRFDDLAAEIEAALEDWEIPGFEGSTIRLGDTDMDVIAEGTRKPVGAVGLVWHVCYSRPWRPREIGTRPHTVNVSIQGDAPERLITNDRGVSNPPPTFDEDDFLEGVPSFLSGRMK